MRSEGYQQTSFVDHLERMVGIRESNICFASNSHVLVVQSVSFRLEVTLSKREKPRRIHKQSGTIVKSMAEPWKLCQLRSLSGSWTQAIAY